MQCIESEFNNINPSELITEKIFMLWAKPFFGVLWPDFKNIIWRWGSLDFPELRSRARSFPQLFEILWLQRSSIQDILQTIDSLKPWQLLEKPIELISNWDSIARNLLTSMKRPSGETQFTIMSQARLFNFINNIKQSSAFMKFSELKPKWSTGEEQGALQALLKDPYSWDLDMGKAINCVIKSFESLLKDIMAFEWLQDSTELKSETMHNSEIIQSITGTENEMLLLPFDEQIKMGLVNISTELKRELVLMHYFIQNSIPRFLLSPESKSWNHIHILNWENKWVMHSIEELFTRFGILDKSQQILFINAVNEAYRHETILGSEKWDMMMQNKNSIIQWWQSTLMPIWKNISDKSIWISPFSALKSICIIMKHADTEVFYNSKNLLEKMSLCISNLKLWKIGEFWKNIDTINEIIESASETEFAF